MLPEFTAFGLTLKSYTLFAAVAALVCAVTVLGPLRRCGYSRRGAVVTLLAMALCFLIGARLWNVAVNPAAFGTKRPWYVLRMVGLSLYGGLLGAFAALTVSVRLTGAKLSQVLDAFVLPAALAFAVARVGCFLNGCCGGIRTELPWGVAFPGAAASLPGTLFSFGPPKVHPTQLYELGLALAGVPLCRWLVQKLHVGAGGLFCAFLAWGSALRLAVLPLRALPYSPGVKWIAYPALYLCGILAGVLLLRRRRSPQTEGPAADDSFSDRGK